jgi:alpha-ketoglutarate-dependent taurine dioxygenase
MRETENAHYSSASAWTCASAGHLEDWRISLDEEVVGKLAVGADGALDVPAEVVESVRADFANAREELRKGRGFVVFDRIPMDRYTDAEARTIYWRLGHCLGRPVEQNIEGTVLYDVIDTGQSVGEGARFSVTNAESTFHTDAAFADQPPDLVGLLCLRTAVSGGESQLVSAYALHDALGEDERSTFRGDFLFDRRGQFRPGEPELKTAPVFHWDEQGLETRYLDYYMIEGQGQSGEDFSEAQLAALAAARDLLSRPEMQVTFSLEPGQVLFTNNRWILHNRTAYTDHEDPAQRRHYLRLWLR